MLQRRRIELSILGLAFVAYLLVMTVIPVENLTRWIGLHARS
jgi:hypothetical protein